MLNSDQETQHVSAGQGSRLRKALVESTSTIVSVDSQSTAVERTQVQWWTLALPACALLFIGIVFFLNTFVSHEGEVDIPQLSGPVLLQASSSSKPSADKLPDQTFVGSIAYSEINAVAFVNDQMVYEGDIIDGFTVLKIHKNAVEFEKNGERFIQEVGEQLASLQ